MNIHTEIVYTERKNMNQDTLFRMNFIIQDNNATTTKTYLIKIIECVLFENKTSLTLQELSSIIQESYHLEFADSELKEALSNKKAHLICFDGKYSLSPEYSNKMSYAESIEDRLTRLINMFISQNDTTLAQKDIYNLITKHLYYCFNTNKDVLLSLVNGQQICASPNLDVTNDEIGIINKFMSWNNADKNKLIYQIVSYCYVYCSLTTKKNSLLSKSLFRNKHFFLDANIIFRLAGINKDDRQKTLLSFINKCNEVGIRLSYTNSTLDELYRVISSKVQWIKNVTHSKEPLDMIALESYGNDFYNLYIEWCKEPQHIYNDFLAFQRYLLSRVGDVVDKLNLVNCPNYKTENKHSFTTHATSLREYKHAHSHNRQTDASIETDINNVLYILEQRNNKQESLFSTNDYFISADQNLIAWSREHIKGIPLIVLPSIWLTIILRFTGRTDNDYQAFCSFMSLRTHKTANEIDIFSVIKELGFHTDDKSLKEQIVTEILLHKDEYILNNDSHETTIQKAFDTIVSKNNEEREAKFKKERDDKEIQTQKEKQDISLFVTQQERLKNIDVLVRAEYRKKMRTPKKIAKIKNIECVKKSL